ncbi:MAG TPA: hypothetical protein VGS59_08475 [Candidatus Acidoferrales bacterium]|nr:hypothetical protein [Candidatus Acidoferrales bacterium]
MSTKKAQPPAAVPDVGKAFVNLLQDDLKYVSASMVPGSALPTPIPNFYVAVDPGEHHLCDWVVLGWTQSFPSRKCDWWRWTMTKLKFLSIRFR